MKINPHKTGFELTPDNNLETQVLNEWLVKRFVAEATFAGDAVVFRQEMATVKHVEGKNTTVKPHYLQPCGDLAANAHMFLNVPGSAAVSTRAKTRQEQEIEEFQRGMASVDMSSAAVSTEGNPSILAMCDALDSKTTHGTKPNVTLTVSPEYRGLPVTPLHLVVNGRELFMEAGSDRPSDSVVARDIVRVLRNGVDAPAAVVAPVSAVSTEGNTYSHDLGPLRAVDECKPFGGAERNTPFRLPILHAYTDKDGRLKHVNIMSPGSGLHERSGIVILDLDGRKGAGARVSPVIVNGMLVDITTEDRGGGYKPDAQIRALFTHYTPVSPAKTVTLPVVGRCKDCKHWRRMADTNQRGQCDFASLEKMDVYPEDGSSLIITRLNFGCVHFEAKGGV